MGGGGYREGGDGGRKGDRKKGTERGTDLEIDRLTVGQITEQDM